MDDIDQSDSNQYLDANKQPKIKVVVRKRPLNARELQKNEKDVVEPVSDQVVIVKELKEKVDLTKYIEEHHFCFDQVFGEHVSNSEFYMQTVQPLVSALFMGSKVTCFAYGQTGSGKTHTMIGPPQRDDPEVQGMYALAANDIFTLMEDESMRDYSVYISFYDIYCGKLYDLLNNRALVHARENANQKVKIMGITEAQVTSVEELLEVIDYGLNSRITGTTAANSDSSRSHAVLQISIKHDSGKLFGKMSFIDLAGSERGADAFHSKKETRMDGAEINKSLLALKECIRALDQSNKHKPFRGSKLTMVLKDSFQGDKCKTVMIANVSPALGCCEHTLNTLRYADRVKELKKSNREKVNPLMLPRQATNSTKYDLKRKNSDEVEKPKLTGLAAIQQRNEGSKNISRPQTAASSKLAKPKPRSGIPGIGGGKQLVRPKARTDTAPPSNPAPVGGDRIKNLLKNNPNGAGAALRRETDGITGSKEAPSSAAAKKLDESIKNAYKLRMNQFEDAQANDIGISSTKASVPTSKLSSNSNLNSSLRSPMGDMQSPEPLSGDHVETEEDLDELKLQHERLVDVILKEEDNLIANHHKSINSTISSIKDQEQLRHEVDLPGSDVEEYIISLDKILSERLSEAEHLHRMIQEFHKHIKQEQKVSERFYQLQESEQVDMDDY